MKITCDKCSKFGLQFKSENIEPNEYIEGNPNADIWIVGLNPKNDIGHVEMRTKEEFENFDPDCHRYFSDFKKAPLYPPNISYYHNKLLVNMHYHFNFRKNKQTCGF